MTDTPTPRTRLADARHRLDNPHCLCDRCLDHLDREDRAERDDLRDWPDRVGTVRGKVQPVRNA